MIEKRLNIVAVDKGERGHSQIDLKTEAHERFEEAWRVDPEQFNPERNAIERERLHRTQTLLTEFFQPEGKKIVDLGCGFGTMSKFLAEAGGNVLAVDIAKNPLQTLQAQMIDRLVTRLDYVPHTKLGDDFFDLVIATDLIAHLPHNEFRLFFSELARVVQSKGYVLCSSPVDINAEDALSRLIDLAETEFIIEKSCLSYHFLLIRILHFLSIPSKYIEAWQNPELRHELLLQKKGLKRWWLQFNSSPLPVQMWRVVAMLFDPWTQFLKQNRKMMLFFEKVSRTIWNLRGASHLIFIAKRKPLVDPIVEPVQKMERIPKRRVWE
jgi:2-polyprenyl-3-methyl-5-hydroxy-6-metoxy-1,4-benzoquinol methylase